MKDLYCKIDTGSEFNHAYISKILHESYHLRGAMGDDTER